MFPLKVHLGHRQFNRKYTAVFPLGGYFTADPDDLFHAACEVAAEIAVVFPTIRERHEYADVSAK